MEGMLRPDVVVLPDNAQIPARDLVVPPTEFTHRLHEAQPFRYASRPWGSKRQDGQLAAGTLVAFVAQLGDESCVVIDERGLRVEIDPDALRPQSGID